MWDWCAKLFSKRRKTGQIEDVEKRNPVIKKIQQHKKSNKPTVKRPPNISPQQSEEKDISDEEMARRLSSNAASSSISVNTASSQKVTGFDKVYLVQEKKSSLQQPYGSPDTTFSLQNFKNNNDSRSGPNTKTGVSNQTQEFRKAQKEKKSESKTVQQYGSKSIHSSSSTGMENSYGKSIQAKDSLVRRPYTNSDKFTQISNDLSRVRVPIGNSVTSNFRFNKPRDNNDSKLPESTILPIKVIDNNTKHNLNEHTAKLPSNGYSQEKNANSGYPIRTPQRKTLLETSFDYEPNTNIGQTNPQQYKDHIYQPTQKINNDYRKQAAPLNVNTSHDFIAQRKNEFAYSTTSSSSVPSVIKSSDAPSLKKNTVHSVKHQPYSKHYCEPLDSTAVNIENYKDFRRRIHDADTNTVKKSNLVKNTDNVNDLKNNKSIGISLSKPEIDITAETSILDKISSPPKNRFFENHPNSPNEHQSVTSKEPNSKDLFNAPTTRYSNTDNTLQCLSKDNKIYKKNLYGKQNQYDFYSLPINNLPSPELMSNPTSVNHPEKSNVASENENEIQTIVADSILPSEDIWLHRSFITNRSNEQANNTSGDSNAKNNYVFETVPDDVKKHNNFDMQFQIKLGSQENYDQEQDLTTEINTGELSLESQIDLKHVQPLNNSEIDITNNISSSINKFDNGLEVIKSFPIEEKAEITSGSQKLNDPNFQSNALSIFQSTKTFKTSMDNLTLLQEQNNISLTFKSHVAAQPAQNLHISQHKDPNMGNVKRQKVLANHGADFSFNINNTPIVDLSENIGFTPEFKAENFKIIKIGDAMSVTNKEKPELLEEETGHFQQETKKILVPTEEKYLVFGNQTNRRNNNSKFISELDYPSTNSANLNLDQKSNRENTMGVKQTMPNSIESQNSTTTSITLENNDMSINAKREQNNVTNFENSLGCKINSVVPRLENKKETSVKYHDNKDNHKIDENDKGEVNTDKKILTKDSDYASQSRASFSNTKEPPETTRHNQLLKHLNFQLNEPSDDGIQSSETFQTSITTLTQQQEQHNSFSTFNSHVAGQIAQNPHALENKGPTLEIVKTQTALANDGAYFSFNKNNIPCFDLSENKDLIPESKTKTNTAEYDQIIENREATSFTNEEKLKMIKDAIIHSEQEKKNKYGIAEDKYPVLDKQTKDIDSSNRTPEQSKGLESKKGTSVTNEKDLEDLDLIFLDLSEIEDLTPESITETNTAEYDQITENRKATSFTNKEKLKMIKDAITHSEQEKKNKYVTAEDKYPVLDKQTKDIDSSNRTPEQSKGLESKKGTSVTNEKDLEDLDLIFLDLSEIEDLTPESITETNTAEYDQITENRKATSFTNKEKLKMIKGAITHSEQEKKNKYVTAEDKYPVLDKQTKDIDSSNRTPEQSKGLESKKGTSVTNEKDLEDLDLIFLDLSEIEDLTPESITETNTAEYDQITENRKATSFTNKETLKMIKDAITHSEQEKKNKYVTAEDKYPVLDKQTKDIDSSNRTPEQSKGLESKKGTSVTNEKDLEDLDLIFLDLSEIEDLTPESITETNTAEYDQITKNREATSFTNKEKLKMIKDTITHSEQEKKNKYVTAEEKYSVLDKQTKDIDSLNRTPEQSKCIESKKGTSVTNEKDLEDLDLICLDLPEIEDLTPESITETNTAEYDQITKNREATSFTNKEKLKMIKDAITHSEQEKKNKYVTAEDKYPVLDKQTKDIDSSNRTPEQSKGLESKKGTSVTNEKDLEDLDLIFLDLSEIEDLTPESITETNTAEYDQITENRKATSFTNKEKLKMIKGAITHSEQEKKNKYGIAEEKYSVFDKQTKDIDSSNRTPEQSKCIESKKGTSVTNEKKYLEDLEFIDEKTVLPEQENKIKMQYNDNKDEDIIDKSNEQVNINFKNTRDGEIIGDFLKLENNREPFFKYHNKKDNKNGKNDEINKDKVKIDMASSSKYLNYTNEGNVPEYALLMLKENKNTNLTYTSQLSSPEMVLRVLEQDKKNEYYGEEPEVENAVNKPFAFSHNEDIISGERSHSITRKPEKLAESKQKGNINTQNKDIVTDEIPLSIKDAEYNNYATRDELVFVEKENTYMAIEDKQERLETKNETKDSFEITDNTSLKKDEKLQENSSYIEANVDHICKAEEQDYEILEQTRAIKEESSGTNIEKLDEEKDAINLNTYQLQETQHEQDNMHVERNESDEDYVDPIIYERVKSFLEQIKQKAEPFEIEIDHFTELEDSNKYYYIEESLRRLIDKLDDMFDDIGENKKLRNERKTVYRYIFPLFDKLDDKVVENKERIERERKRPK